jgi:hypothetical protein
VIRTYAFFNRLNRHTTLPSIPGLIKIIGVAWLISLALMALPVWRDESLAHPLVTAILTYGYGLMALLPPVTAAYAGLLTSLEADRPEYSLVRLTRLSRKAIVRDLYHTALFRLRWLYAAAAAAFPAMFICGMARTVNTGRPEITSSGVIILSTALWMGLAVLLGAALGVYLGLRWRHHPAPLVAAPTLLVGMMALSALCMVCPFYIGAPIALTAILDHAEKYV